MAIPSVLDWYLSAYLEPAIHLISPFSQDMLATTLLRGWSIYASRQEITPGSPVGVFPRADLIDLHGRTTHSEIATE